MTTSNRFVNRLVVFLLGAVLLIIGAGSIATAAWEPARTWFDDTIGAVAPAVSSRATPPDGTTLLSAGALPVLWPLLVVAAAGVVVAVICVLIMLRRGHGRTGTVLSDAVADGPAGTVSIATGFVQTALTDALSARPDILAVSVGAYEHRSATALKVRVLPRAGVSPRVVVDTVRESVLALDALLGARLPVVLEIASSARAERAKDERVS